MFKRAAFAAALALLASGPAAAAPVVDAAAPAPAAPAAPSVQPAPAAASVFAGAGLLIADAGSVDPRILATEMNESGFHWVAVKVLDGATVVNREQFALGWADRLRERGILVGGWGVLRDEPERDAAAATAAVAQDRFGFYIADAEYEYSSVGGDAGRSARFVRAFRARSTLPAALSSFGRVDGAYGFDWQSWRAAGFEYLPQSYLADGAAFAPELSVAAALAVWPRSMIHPTIGLYGGVTAGAYGGRGLGGGFSVFPADTMSPTDFRTLAPYAHNERPD